VPARESRMYYIAQCAGLPSIPHSYQKGRVLARHGMTGSECFTTPRFERDHGRDGDAMRLINRVQNLDIASMPVGFRWSCGTQVPG